MPVAEHSAVSPPEARPAFASAAAVAAVLSLALAAWFFHAWLLARQAVAHISAGSLLLLPGDWQVPRMLWVLAVVAAVVVLAYMATRGRHGQGVASAIMVLTAAAALALSIWLTPAHFTTSVRAPGVVRPGRYLIASLLCLPALLCFAREAIMAARRNAQK